jgi:hypothetical protein
MKSSEIVNAIDGGEVSSAAKSAEDALLEAVPVDSANNVQTLKTTTTATAKPKAPAAARKNNKKPKNKQKQPKSA